MNLKQGFFFPIDPSLHTRPAVKYMNFGLNTNTV